MMRPWRWTGAIALLIVSLASFAQSSVDSSRFNSIAFYYGANPPLADLQAFDIAVVEPAHVPDPRRHARAAKDGTHALFAYVSLGEVQPSRHYYRDLPPGALRGANEVWGSRVIDQNAPGWSEFFLSRIVAPLWEQGWRGFFIDTLDSYQLFAKDEAERTVQTQAMVRTLRELKLRYPEARLILNRGFELLPEMAALTHAVAAESLYQGYDAGRRHYRPVPADDRAWLLAQLETVRDQYRLPVIAIDYVDPMQPGARELARQTASRIRAHGFIPWVADGRLESIGVGSIELIPRAVLVLVDTKGNDLHYSEAQRFVGMPLNHLGLRYEFIDLALDSLPDTILRGRYAGVVTWFESGMNHPALLPWLTRRMQEGVRIAMFNAFGFNAEPQSAGALGLHAFRPGKPGHVAVQSRDTALIGFEAEAIPERGQEVPVSLQGAAGRSLLRLSDARGNSYDAAALMPWGGYVLAPFAVVNLPMQDQSRWVVNPIAFLKAALELPQLPVPDVTTEGGRRILMVHIDGDGFASRAERPGAPFASEVLLTEFLERYRVPTTMSVIEGEVGAQGFFQTLAPELESIARRMFALEHVEGASHSYSHPFYWASAINAQGRVGEAPYHLRLPGYAFDLTREIKGSLDYINEKLMPTGKTAAVLLWTGNCVPPAAAIAEADRHGALNMNGGDTVITESNRSLTAIAAQGLRKNGRYQVFAPNQNENVYTNNWSGPYYGYERVIETFKLSETPLRFKPIDIYYHTYAASKPASIAALHKVYRWALAQPTTPLYASQYIRKVLDFETTTLARELASNDLLVRTGADLRTLRLPPDVDVPSLSASSGVAGVAPGPEGSYLILASGQARLSMQPDSRRLVHVHDANGSISNFSRGRTAAGTELRFTLVSNVPAVFRLAQAATCHVAVDGRSLAPAADTSDAGLSLRRYAIGPSSSLASRHQVQVQCPS